MFELAAPWILLLWPLPWLVQRFMAVNKAQASSALKVPFLDALLQHGLLTSSIFFKHQNFLWSFMIWSLLLFALAGPRWVGQPQSLLREGYNIMMVLDVSGSMEFNDMQVQGRAVTRLSVVKEAAKRFVEARAGDRIGLILFGSKAYLQTPLTFDRHNVLMRLSDASVGLAGNTTSIGDALGVAVKRLQHVPSQGRVIVLLTDGVNNSGVLAPLKAAQLARDASIKVYTIGLGAEHQIQSFGGFLMQSNPAADLDEKTLKDVANLTHGQYFRATSAHSLQKIYAKINQLERSKQKEALVRPQKDYYPWPLAAAMVLFFAGLFRRLLS